MSFLLPEQVMNLQGDSSEEWAVGCVVSYFPSCLHSRRHAFTVGNDGRERGQEGSAGTAGVKGLQQPPFVRSKLSV